MRLKVFLAVVAMLSASLAHADTVTLTLTNPNGNVPATGGSLTYDATVSAPLSNSFAVFLNGDSFNVTAPVTLNDNDFFSGFPQSLAPGTSFTGALFVLTVPSSAPPATYQGTFTLVGGPNADFFGTLGTVDFSISNTGVAAVPEPSSFALFGMGLLGIAGAVRKRFA